MPVLSRALKCSRRVATPQEEAAASDDSAEVEDDAAVRSDEDGTDDEEASPVGAEKPQNTDGAPAEMEIHFAEPSSWLERLAISATKPLPEDLNADDDPKREEVFLQQALQSCARAVSLLEKAKVPWRRPPDFYAEMYKSDVHMEKVRDSIMRSKTEVEERSHRRQMKEQKKFGKEVQAEVMRERARYKREMMDKVSEWRKKRGRTDEQLEDELETAPPPGKQQRGEGEKRRGGHAAVPKRKVLAPGGKKKRPGKSRRIRK